VAPRFLIRDVSVWLPESDDNATDLILKRRYGEDYMIPRVAKSKMEVLRFQGDSEAEVAALTSLAKGLTWEDLDLTSSASNRVETV
jgi:hypothetical protein